MRRQRPGWGGSAASADERIGSRPDRSGPRAPLGRRARARVVRVAGRGRGVGWVLWLLCGVALAVWAAPADHAGAQAGARLSVSASPVKPTKHRTIALRLVVDSALDEPDDAPGDGLCRSAPSAVCTLRAAIMEANVHDGEERIELPAGLFRLTRLGADEDAADTGDLDLSGPATIVGVGAGRTVVDGNATDRVFDVQADADVILTGLTIQNGALVAETRSAEAEGGGVRNDGTLTLLDAVIRDNAVSAAYGHGGGLANSKHGYVLLADSTLDGNRVTGDHSRGGGLDNRGEGDLLRSTLSRNEIVGGNGAGLANGGDEDLRLANVTISANAIVGRRGRGGGLWNDGALHVTNATIANNRAPSGEAGAIFNTREPFSVDLAATILAGNGRKNCSGRVASRGDNLEDADSCGLRAFGDLVDRNPRLDALAEHGGPTETHALLPGSPAIDGGLNSLCDLTDQRNRPRYVDGDGDGSFFCDIGAVERQTAERTLAERSPAGRLSSDQRRQRERTNRSGHDDERTEGQVVAVACEDDPPAASIATLDGPQLLLLSGKAKQRCAVIAVGDYLQAEGVKETEQRFQADDFVLEGAPRAAPEPPEPPDLEQRRPRPTPTPPPLTAGAPRTSAPALAVAARTTAAQRSTPRPGATPIFRPASVVDLRDARSRDGSIRSR